jgi:hypothetical protein
MPVQIDGIDFSLFADRDRANLERLSFGGRVDWFEKRFNRMLVGPLERLRPTNRGTHEDDLWSILVFGTVLLSAIEALGSFCSTAASNRARFEAFVETFMPESYQSHLGTLWSLRNSLTHGLIAETGRFEFFDGTSIRVQGELVEIDPDALFRDFIFGWDAFLTGVRAGELGSPIRLAFELRFAQRYKVPRCNA